MKKTTLKNDLAVTDTIKRHVKLFDVSGDTLIFIDISNSLYSYSISKSTITHKKRLTGEVSQILIAFNKIFCLTSIGLQILTLNLRDVLLLGLEKSGTIMNKSDQGLAIINELTNETHILKIEKPFSITVKTLFTPSVIDACVGKEHTYYSTRDNKVIICSDNHIVNTIVDVNLISTRIFVYKDKLILADSYMGDPIRLIRIKDSNTGTLLNTLELSVLNSQNICLSDNRLIIKQPKELIIYNLKTNNKITKTIPINFESFKILATKNTLIVQSGTGLKIMHGFLK